MNYSDGFGNLVKTFFQRSADYSWMQERLRAVTIARTKTLVMEAVALAQIHAMTHLTGTVVMADQAEMMAAVRVRGSSSNLSTRQLIAAIYDLCPKEVQP